MEIKKGIVSDASIISSILAQSWKIAFKGSVPQVYLDELKEDHWVEFFTKGIADKTVTVQLAYKSEKPVGCISYGKSRDPKVPEWGEVVTLYLLPDAFGKGYGKALLEVALTEMEKRGYESAYLWVLTENDRARKFYESQGFSWNGDKYFFEIQGKTLVNLRYVKEI